MSQWNPAKGLRIAIDGPSGSGKGTIAVMVGEALGLAVMDTGLLYRFLGWRANDLGVDLDDESAVVAVIDNAVADMDWRAEGIFFENRDCTPLLRGEDVGACASKVAAIPSVRKQLLELQRKIAASGCVMDGRDIGTVVLPDAEAKFFLTASPRERARRRWEQLQQGGEEVALDQIVDDLKARDARDSGRDCSPLERAKDAIEIDSTTMRIDEVVDRILAVLERRKLIS
ncbi:MAG: (d)CMP kinase [Mariprofundaceae bacterium]|nr:(d)CMP kinase [Mariprofundaceae bacterium]